MTKLSILFASLMLCSLSVHAGAPADDLRTRASPGAGPEAKAAPARAADRITCISLGKSHSLFCHLIEIWCFEHLLTITAQVAITQIVGEEDNEVGLGASSRALG